MEKTDFCKVCGKEIIKGEEMCKECLSKYAIIGVHIWD